ncbi:hypothetical protein DC522_23945 [Microvirga sp. KLBC 81]|uniref:hypothetical protein n=1 Tax=Microvirga sp. KLBC 81 TaxID=1862707 RepID=UPI000D513C42|nr:hypothetical protein [Microvirga sp. KLBC 81]PVE21919.1 hypothetical protein DC522_23945 [Microvirga sp. KLBC 81]
MVRVFSLAIACVLALSAGAEGAPSRKRNTSAQERPAPQQAVQEQDEFLSCDVAVREFVQGRKEAAALSVTDVKADGLRMTLRFVHPYGETGDTPPNLAFTRGESLEERRKALNETKQRARLLAEAARTGNVWYVIAVRKESRPGEERRSSTSAQTSEGQQLSADAVVMASIEGRCIPVSQYEAVPLNSLSSDLQQALGQREREASPAENARQPPPS